MTTFNIIETEEFAPQASITRKALGNIAETLVSGEMPIFSDAKKELSLSQKSKIEAVYRTCFNGQFKMFFIDLSRINLTPNTINTFKGSDKLEILSLIFPHIKNSEKTSTLTHWLKSLTMDFDIQLSVDEFHIIYDRLFDLMVLYSAQKTILSWISGTTMEFDDNGTPLDRDLATMEHAINTIRTNVNLIKLVLKVAGIDFVKNSVFYSKFLNVILPKDLGSDLWGKYDIESGFVKELFSGLDKNNRLSSLEDNYVSYKFRMFAQRLFDVGILDIISYSFAFKAHDIGVQLFKKFEKIKAFSIDSPKTNFIKRFDKKMDAFIPNLNSCRIRGEVPTSKLLQTEMIYDGFITDHPIGTIVKEKGVLFFVGFTNLKEKLSLDMKKVRLTKLLCKLDTYTSTELEVKLVQLDTYKIEFSFDVYPNDINWSGVYKSFNNTGIGACMSHDTFMGTIAGSTEIYSGVTAYCLQYFNKGDNGLALIVAKNKVGKLCGRGIYDVHSKKIIRWYGNNSPYTCLHKLGIVKNALVDCNNNREAAYNIKLAPVVVNRLHQGIYFDERASVQGVLAPYVDFPRQDMDKWDGNRVNSLLLVLSKDDQHLIPLVSKWGDQDEVPTEDIESSLKSFDLNLSDGDMVAIVYCHSTRGMCLDCHIRNWFLQKDDTLDYVSFDGSYDLNLTFARYFAELELPTLNDLVAERKQFINESKLAAGVVDTPVDDISHGLKASSIIVDDVQIPCEVAA